MAWLSFERKAARPRHWAQALQENPLARFVPFSSLLTEHDVITRGGDFLRVWRLDGVAFECADEHLIAERHEAVCSLLRNLAGGQWALWMHRLHRHINRHIVGIECLVLEALKSNDGIPVDLVERGV